MADKKPLCLYSGQPSGLASNDHVFGIMPFSSSTSLTVGYGSKTLTVDAGLKLYPSRFYRLISAANPAIWMEGKCTSYSGTSFVINIDMLGAGGTAADWLIDTPRNKASLKPTASYTSLSTVLSDVPGLTANFLAGVSYELRFYGFYQSNTSTNGGKINLNYTGTPDILTGKLTASLSSASALASELAWAMRDGVTSITSTGVSPINVNHHIGFTAVIKFPADTSATIQLAAEVDTNSTTLDILSCWVIDRLL